MPKSFKDFLQLRVSANDFELGARDAYDTAQNINAIFVKRAGWFSTPKPIPLTELCRAYKELCPDMEIYHPGVVDKTFHPQIITQLGFPVDVNGLVHWQP